MEEIASSLVVQDFSCVKRFNDWLLIDNVLFRPVDYGMTTGSDWNMCFYLSVERGDQEQADRLKRYLAGRVRRLDEGSSDHGTLGAMADEEIVLTYVLESGRTVCVYNEAAERCQLIRPAESKDGPDQWIFLLHSSSHYQRLYPVKRV